MKYIKPSMEVFLIDEETDVITTSTLTEGDGSGDSGAFGELEI